MKRVRITNDRLNSYGFRVLTEGVDIKQFEKNPVLLHMHRRGEVIGYVKDIKSENGEITGELLFDEATELSRQCKKQFEFGSLRMVSAGLTILEMSEAKEHLVQGQTRPTVTKSKLTEVSLVDIGANDDAIVLWGKDGKEVKLGQDGECDLPLIINNVINKKEMELKTLALQLGLPATATEEEVNAKINLMAEAQQENEKLRKENETLLASQIETAVSKAIAEKRIGEDKRSHFVELGKKVGVEALETTFAAMSPHVRLSQVLGHQGGTSGGTQPITNTYIKLSDVPGDKWLELKENQPEEYRRLYEAEYGMALEE